MDFDALPPAEERVTFSGKIRDSVRVEEGETCVVGSGACSSLNIRLMLGAAVPIWRVVEVGEDVGGNRS